MFLNKEFLSVYEKLSEINQVLSEGAVPKFTSEVINLNNGREIISTKYNRLLGEYETNCVTEVNGQLSRIEVRTFVLKKENDIIYFLGRKCTHSTGYTTPGGGFDLRDLTPSETAKRELREELNINLTNVQESTYNTFYSLPRSAWVKKYVENPEDRWTGYYQYYVTAEYAGESDNNTPEEIGKFSWIPISVFENPTDPAGSLMLRIIAEHRWSNAYTDLSEAFDNEEVYGEAAKTIPGVLRYFVDNIDTLASIIERGRILASTGESETSQSEKARGTVKPFVSFSHQLFSHAFRRNNKWKYGIAVSQEKLEQKVAELSDTKIQDNFIHQGKSMYVYGAAKLADGTDVLITSFGNFEMNLSDSQRKALSDLKRTDFYEQVKKCFNTYLEARRKDKLTNPTKTLEVSSFDCTENTDDIREFLNVSTNVLEGFLLKLRRPSTGVNFPIIYKEVPGLFDYLQDHTKLNEGELRVWLPKGEKWLDISNCIIGLVLPSNYKENNYDNLNNNASDVTWLRKLVKKHDLTLYVYQSDDASNIPGLDTSPKRPNTLEKDSVIEYFHKITQSRNAVIDFIKNELTKYKQTKSGGYNQLYHYAIASHTTLDTLDITSNDRYNYRAFLNAISEYDLTSKDVASIYKTGSPLLNAKEVFLEKTESAGAVQEFLKSLTASYPEMPLYKAYLTWFTRNTNAVRPNADYLEPASISWKNFVAVCNQKFGYTARDLTAMSKNSDQLTDDTPVREPIKILFNKAASTSKKSTLQFIKDFAQLAKEKSLPSMALAYTLYMGKYAADSSAGKVRTDPKYNYKAWLEKVANPTGPVKLTKEAALDYYKEFKQ